MDFIITPAWNAQSILGIASQISLGLGFAYFETTGKFNIPYSKFNKGGSINIRLAAFLVYFFPLLTYAAFYLQAGAPRSPYHLALLAAFVLHFAKRCLESLFLHRFSKNIGLPVLIVVSLAYTSVAAQAGRIHNMETPEGAGYALASPLLIIGALIMGLGESANLYHHYLLAHLRKDGEKGYRVPEGGLFRYVACPHYLAEIISWFGYALMSRQLGLYGTLFVFTCYLAARSRRTSAWYKENVAGYPAGRRSLVPGLF